MTKLKFKADDWVKCDGIIRKIIEVDDINCILPYRLENLGWVSKTSVSATTTPELIAHLEAKSNELVQVEFAAKNERHEIDRQIHLLKTNTEML
jgi:hypothetical protein